MHLHGRPHWHGLECHGQLLCPLAVEAQTKPNLGACACSVALWIRFQFRMPNQTRGECVPMRTPELSGTPVAIHGSKSPNCQAAAPFLAVLVTESWNQKIIVTVSTGIALVEAIKVDPRTEVCKGRRFSVFCSTKPSFMNLVLELYRYYHYGWYGSSYSCCCYSSCRCNNTCSRLFVEPAKLCYCLSLPSVLLFLLLLRLPEPQTIPGAGSRCQPPTAPYLIWKLV